MQFRDLKTQYQHLKEDIDREVIKVMDNANFIMGSQVKELEKELAEYVGVKHCISCGNGTDALQLTGMALDFKKGEAIFVPDFTFFASGEIVSLLGATPVFVDVDEKTFNMSPEKLEKRITQVLEDGKFTPKAIIAVDLFGLPADFISINKIADKYGLTVIEDGAQGFGGRIKDQVACGLSSIGTTSFFPAKPLGCYGDGGAIFTDNDEWADTIKSYRVHGKGDNKYDNVRIGLNSRLDTIQAAVLKVKLNAFREYELEAVNKVAARYTELLKNVDGVETPLTPDGFYSSWAQYTLKVKDREIRDSLQTTLKAQGIPSMIYYPKPMSTQLAFKEDIRYLDNLETTKELCDTVLSLPMHPYLADEEIEKVVKTVEEFYK
ncbi:MAG: DegT/DnrJ/EryC1/StrS family aminotransferase [Clostridiales bacterium]|nr:DegT/DnrJ/EryC1/StrS family aminotransferase [Clostridiales bacterium]MDD7347312.1 DegT/DnrJ/EryC1/StrS family aminotransferase [Clostridiales bacterium]